MWVIYTKNETIKISIWRNGGKRGIKVENIRRRKIEEDKRIQINETKKRMERFTVAWIKVFFYSKLKKIVVDS